MGMGVSGDIEALLENNVCLDITTGSQGNLVRSAPRHKEVTDCPDSPLTTPACAVNGNIGCLRGRQKSGRLDYPKRCVEMFLSKNEASGALIGRNSIWHPIKPEKNTQQEFEKSPQVRHRKKAPRRIFWKNRQRFLRSLGWYPRY
jgi:hypothetical protein